MIGTHQGLDLNIPFQATVDKGSLGPILVIPTTLHLFYVHGTRREKSL